MHTDLKTFALEEIGIGNRELFSFVEDITQDILDNDDCISQEPRS